VQSLTPASSKAGAAAFTLTLTGTNFAGATGLVFTTSRGNGGQGDNGNDKGKTDDAFTISNIVVNAAGTQVTATVKIAANAQSGQRIVRVVTLNGESSGKTGSGNIFTILP